jgi:transcriptional repressor NrdR
VAFLRFASVYKQFESADDFEIEIASLRKHRAEQLSQLLDDTALDESQDHLTSAPSG